MLEIGFKYVTNTLQYVGIFNVNLRMGPKIVYMLILYALDISNMYATCTICIY